MSQSRIGPLMGTEADFVFRRGDVLVSVGAFLGDKLPT